MFRKEDAETLAVACVAALAIVIIAASIAFGQCPNGQCPESRQTQSNSAMCDNQPTPAWRYERAIGHRSAIVRIYGEDGKGLRSIGSGTLVRWSGRIVVLTARHVIRDAKGIVVWLVTGTKHRARVLRVDTVWDCAVLELEGRPEGIRPVELAYGREAVFGKGARLDASQENPYFTVSGGAHKQHESAFLGQTAAGGSQTSCFLTAHYNEGKRMEQSTRANAANG